MQASLKFKLSEISNKNTWKTRIAKKPRIWKQNGFMLLQYLRPDIQYQYSNIPSFVSEDVVNIKAE
jgi:hypothetical protein